MNTEDLQSRLGAGRDITLTYDELGYEPAEDMQAVNEIVATAKAMGFGTTNDIAGRRIQFWKREERLSRSRK